MSDRAEACRGACVTDGRGTPAWKTPAEPRRALCVPKLRRCRWSCRQGPGKALPRGWRGCLPLLWGRRDVPECDLPSRPENRVAVRRDSCSVKAVGECLHGRMLPSRRAGGGVGIPTGGGEAAGKARSARVAGTSREAASSSAVARLSKSTSEAAPEPGSSVGLWACPSVHCSVRSN